MDNGRNNRTSLFFCSAFLFSYANLANFSVANPITEKLSLYCNDRLIIVKLVRILHTSLVGLMGQRPS